jgi:uncharacterized repeat protein (TIGR01451 family)
MIPAGSRGQTPAGIPIPNIAHGFFDGGEGVVRKIPSNEVITIVGEGSLHVVKSADRPEVSLWDTLVYTLTIQNIKANPLTGISVRDTLPRMLRVIHAEPSALAADNTVEWQIPLLEAGETRTLQLTCRVIQAAYQETFENSAVYSADSGIRGRSNRVITAWLPWPEAMLEKTADRPLIYAGDTLTYSLHILNTGPMALSQIQVSDLLPDGFDFLNASADIRTENGRLIWSIANLEIGGERMLSFRGIVTADVQGDTLHNTASLYSKEGAHASDQVSVLYRGQGVGLRILKEAADSLYWAGDTVTYDLILTNSGTRTGHHIVVRDTLPSELRYIESTHYGSNTGQIVVWHLNQVKAGYHDTLRVSASVRVPVQDLTRVNNKAWVTSSEGAQDSSHWEIQIRSVSKAQLKKSADLNQVYDGDTLTYTLEVRNQGTTRLSQITVRDTLPEGLQVLSSDPPAEYSGGVLSWTVGTLNYQTKQLLKVETLVHEVHDQILRNTAVLTVDTISVSSTHSVPCRGHGVGIEIIKEAPDSVYWAGDTLTYDLILSNGGLRAGHSVVVRDTLPDKLEYLQSTHGGSLDNHTVTWHLGSLEPGYHDTLRTTVRIRVPIEDHTRINNEVWAYTSQGAQDSSSWEITVRSEPDLLLEILGPEIAFPGDTIQYTLIFSNVGTATAFEPVLKDTLPGFLDYIRATGEHIHLPETDAVHWTLPPLRPGDRDTLFLYARIRDDVTAEDEIINSAWLSYRLASHVAIATCITDTRSPGENVYAYKKVNKTMASEGDTLTYWITFGSFNHEVRDTLTIVDNLPAEIEWISSNQYSKPVERRVSYNPVMHQIRFVHTGLLTSARDSLKLTMAVRSPLASGIQEIENQALVIVRNDTVRTADDSRTRSITRLVKPFLSVKKAVNRKVAEIGDVMTYTITCENKSLLTPLTSLVITDLLPHGFRYQQGTAILDSAHIPDPEYGINGHRILMRWVLNDTLQPGGIIRLKYRTIIGLDARLGESENLANAAGLTPFEFWVNSEETGATVLVQQGVLDERGFIFGKVFEDRNRNGLFDRGEPVLKSVELILEDGTRVRSDEYGKYSIPNVEYGQHVLRLNENTLPGNLKPISKDFGILGDPRSRLIIVPPGGMAKANFTAESIE